MNPLIYAVYADGNEGLRAQVLCESLALRGRDIKALPVSRVLAVDVTEEAATPGGVPKEASVPDTCRGYIFLMTREMKKPADFAEGPFGVAYGRLKACYPEAAFYLSFENSVENESERSMREDFLSALPGLSGIVDGDEAAGIGGLVAYWPSRQSLGRCITARPVKRKNYEK